MKKMLLLLPALMLAACFGRACGSGVGVEAKLWRPELETKIRAGEDDLDGTDLSLEADIDIDSTDDVPWIKVWLGTAHRLTFTYMEVEFSGESNPDINFDFGGERYSTSIEAKAKLDATVYRIAWEADWWHSKNFRLGTIFGTEIFDTEISVENDIAGKEKVEVSIPVPILGLQGEIGLPFGFGVYGEVAGLYVGYGNFEGGFIEWELGAKYSFGKQKNFSVMAGYRALDITLEEDDDKADLELGGFAFGIGLKF